LYAYPRSHLPVPLLALPMPMLRTRTAACGERTSPMRARMPQPRAPGRASLRAPRLHVHFLCKVARWSWGGAAMYMNDLRATLALAAVLWTAPALASPFTILSTRETRAGNLRRITQVVQNGDNPLDRFGVERVVKQGSDQRHLRGAVVLV